jgi:hypothetical protein
MVALTVIHMIEFRGAPGRHRRWWVLLGALVLAAVFTPWLYLVLAVGIGLGIGAMRRRPHAPKRFTWPAYAVVAILAVPAVILSLYTVWVPHEKVNFLPRHPPIQQNVQLRPVAGQRVYTLTGPPQG